MATESKSSCIEEFDVFTVPHCRMKHLLKQLVRQVDSFSYIYVYI